MFGSDSIDFLLRRIPSWGCTLRTVFFCFGKIPGEFQRQRLDNRLGLLQGGAGQCGSGKF